MANSTAELTDTQIKRARTKLKEYNLSDGRGLQLRIKPSGLKVWLFNYQRPVSGKRTNIKLGQYPDLSLRSARKLRQDYRTLLAEGIDPQKHRVEVIKLQSEANANTLRSVADVWFEIKSHEISEHYAKDLYSSLANHVFPRIGDTPIHLIQARMVIEVLEPLQIEEKLELVKRLCQRLNMIMDFAVIRGIIEVNPLGPIGKAFKAPKKKHLPSLSPSELPELVQAIEKANITMTTRCLMEWQLHTMVRPAEAAGAKWSEMNIAKRLWKIPANRMKKERAHIVPLTEQMLGILRQMQPISGKREFVFPSARNPRSHASSAAVNMALRRMGYKGKLVSHGFRSLASTVLNEKGIEPDLIESALAHVDSNSVRAAYNRTDYIERRGPIMQWWSDYLEDAKQ